PLHRSAHHVDALDCRHPVPRAVVREIRIGLGGEVRLIEPEQRCLDVKTAVLGVKAQDPGRRSLAERMLAEGVLHRGDAFVGRKQTLDVASRQKNGVGSAPRFNAGRTGCNAGAGSRLEIHGRARSQCLKPSLGSTAPSNAIFSLTQSKASTIASASRNAYIARWRSGSLS